MKTTIKKRLKKIPGVSYLMKQKKALEMKREYRHDYHFFRKYYLYARKTPARMEYDMLLIIHSLEKGMSNQQARPFGIQKVDKLIHLLTDYRNLIQENTFAYVSACNCLKAYQKFYGQHNWTDHKEYTLVEHFLKQIGSFPHLPVGAFELKKTEFIQDAKIDYAKFLNSRHSVRNFSNQKLSKTDIKKAIHMAMQSPSACNRQMCKIYNIENQKKAQSVIEYAQGLGNFDLTNIHFLVITFDVQANYFIGERNQGWFNAGLMSMNLVNAFHSLGIGSCFIQFGNTFRQEEELKEILEIPESERIAVILAVGYYAEISKIPYSSRKSIDEIYLER